MEVLGVYDMIMLFKLNFSPNIKMSLSLLGFWNSTINAFVFLFDIMSPSLFDVPVMLGPPIIGKNIPTLYDEDFEELGCPVSKENYTYGKYMEIHRCSQGAMSNTEHNAFFFFWLCKFFSVANHFLWRMSSLIMSRL